MYFEQRHACAAALRMLQSIVSYERVPLFFGGGCVALAVAVRQLVNLGCLRRAAQSCSGLQQYVNSVTSEMKI